MNIRRNILASVARIAFIAFDNEPGWKKDENGNLALSNGNPIYITADGKEMVTESGTIARLNGEAKQHRERAERAETALNKFSVEGKLIDPETAIKAVDTVSKLDLKKLIDAGEIDKVRDQIKGEFGTVIAEKDRALTDLQSKYDNSQISNIFSNSEFIRERVAAPRDMFEAYMRSNFKMENGQIAAYDRSGNRLMSKKRAGEYADADEALELLVDMHPQKDTILKASDASGSGNGGGGGNRGGNRTMSRADFGKLSPAQQAEQAGKMRTGELTLTD